MSEKEIRETLNQLLDRMPARAKPTRTLLIALSERCQETASVLEANAAHEDFTKPWQNAANNILLCASKVEV